MLYANLSKYTIQKSHYCNYSTLKRSYNKNINKTALKEYSTKDFFINRTISLAEKFNIQAAKKNKMKNNSLMKITNKTFLSKIYKGFFEGLVFQRINKDEEYVEISDPVIMENGKLKVLDMNNTSPDKIANFLMFASYPLIAYSGFKLILAVSSFSILKSVMWTTILFFSLKFRFGLKSNREHIINEISVLKDGKTCEIKTLKGVFPIDINKIRKINLEEAMFMAQRLDLIKSRFIPIVMDTKLYLIPLECTIHRNDLLPHISEGKYLKFAEVISKDKTIQL